MKTHNGRVFMYLNKLVTIPKILSLLKPVLRAALVVVYN